MKYLNKIYRFKRKLTFFKKKKTYEPTEIKNFNL